jgi:phosphatidylinositol alpha 1,6-mannosyltransferase
MRVLISAESFLPRTNGVTNSVLRTVRFLKERGHEVLVIAPGEGPTSVEAIPIKRVPALAFQRFAQVDIPGVPTSSLIKVIEDFKPDIVHLASPFLLGEQVRKAAQVCGVPVVANYQTDVSGFINFYRLTTAKILVEKRLKKIHNGSTITLAPSSDSEAYLTKLGISRIIRWGRGVDLAQFNPRWRSMRLRKSWGADENSCVVGFVGRLAPEKQVEKLSHLSDIGKLTGKKVIQVIVGDGPSRSSLQKALPDAIFLGHQSGESLSRAMASMDLLITTGENETFCQVIQEGMAAGLPVIAPEIGGPKDLINNGVDGLFYKPGDNFDIRKKVLQLVNDDSSRRSMSENAFNKVQDRTWAKVCSELFEIYESTLEGRVKEGQAS